MLVVSFDALRADTLGSYGYDRQTAPNIDQFANRSIVFENAHSAAPVTPTSFAAAFTGPVTIPGLLLPRTTMDARLDIQFFPRTFAFFRRCKADPQY